MVCVPWGSFLRLEHTYPSSTGARTSASEPASAFFSLLSPPGLKGQGTEPDTSSSRRLIKCGFAGGEWLGVLGLEWRSISNCFSVGKKKNSPLTVSGAARLVFFSGTLQPCQRWLWEGGRASGGEAGRHSQGYRTHTGGGTFWSIAWQVVGIQEVFVEGRAF